MNGRIFSLRLAYVDIVMLGSIFLAMSLDFATLTSVKKVRNLQHENLPIQDINFPTKNSKSPDLGSRMYHMYDTDADGIRITVCASHSNLFVGYMNCHIFYFIFVAQIQGKKIQNI